MKVELVREQITYWTERSEQALRAAAYANNQLEQLSRHLCELTGVEYEEAPVQLTLIMGGKEDDEPLGAA